MADDTITTASLNLNMVVLPTPAAGEQITIRVRPGQSLQMPVDHGDQTAVLSGDDLRIEWNNGAVLILEDFASQEIPPLLQMSDGTVIPADLLLAALEATPDETAAGETGPDSGGSGEYRDDLGDLIEGVDRLGPQDPDPFALGLEPPLEDEQNLDIVAAEAEDEPENEPPSANDDSAFVNLGIGAFAISSRSQGDFYQVTLEENGPGYQKLFETDIGLFDITLAPDGLVWGVAHGKEQGTKTQTLVMIDPVDETVNFGGIIDGLDNNSPIDGLTFADDGTLYVIQGDTLYALSNLDSDTPLATEVLDLGTIQGSGDLVSVNGLLFTLSQNGHLIAIDPVNGTITDLGSTGLSPGAYGIAEGPDGTLFMVSHKEVYEILPNAEDFTILDQFDLDDPQGEGTPWGLAGGVPLATTIEGDVLSNDTDPEDDPLIVTLVNGEGVPSGDDGVTINGEFGTLTMFQDGTYLYTTSSMATGEETFEYTVDDGNGGTDTAYLTIYVNATVGTGGADNLLGDAGDDIFFGGQGDDVITSDDGSDLFIYSAKGGEDTDTITDFDIDHDTLRLIDVLDGDDGLPGLDDVNVAVTVSGDDVELAINGSEGTTTVVLQDVNTGGAFDAVTSLQDLVDAGLKVEFNSDSYAS